MTIAWTKVKRSNSERKRKLVAQVAKFSIISALPKVWGDEKFESIFISSGKVLLTKKKKKTDTCGARHREKDNFFGWNFYFRLSRTSVHILKPALRRTDKGKVLEHSFRTFSGLYTQSNFGGEGKSGKQENDIMWKERRNEFNQRKFPGNWCSWCEYR